MCLLGAVVLGDLALLRGRALRAAWRSGRSSTSAPLRCPGGRRRHWPARRLLVHRHGVVLPGARALPPGRSRARPPGVRGRCSRSSPAAYMLGSHEAGALLDPLRSPGHDRPLRPRRSALGHLLLAARGGARRGRRARWLWLAPGLARRRAVGHGRSSLAALVGTVMGAVETQDAGTVSGYVVHHPADRQRAAASRWSGSCSSAGSTRAWSTRSSPASSILAATTAAVAVAAAFLPGRRRPVAQSVTAASSSSAAA